MKTKKGLLNGFEEINLNQQLQIIGGGTQDACTQSSDGTWSDCGPEDIKELILTDLLKLQDVEETTVEFDSNC